MENKSFNKTDAPKHPIHFKKLQDYWYQKLKDSGFKDIENIDYPHLPHHDPQLVVYHSSYFFKFEQEHKGTIEDHQSYFDRCSEFLHRYQDWNHERELLIWTYYCDGLSTRKISSSLRSENKIHLGYGTVHIILTKLIRIMKGSEWYGNEEERVLEKRPPLLPFLRGRHRSPVYLIHLA